MNRKIWRKLLSRSILQKWNFVPTAMNKGMSTLHCALNDTIDISDWFYVGFQSFAIIELNNVWYISVDWVPHYHQQFSIWKQFWILFYNWNNIVLIPDMGCLHQHLLILSSCWHLFEITFDIFIQVHEYFSLHRKVWMVAQELVLNFKKYI